MTASHWQKPSRAIMDKIPSSLFLPPQQPRAYLGHQHPPTGTYRQQTSSSRTILPPVQPKQPQATYLEFTASGESSHLFGQAQKNSGDDCCCAMSPPPLPMHPQDCEECVQSCEDPGCTIELTPQCTDQCVVVCDDTHHNMAACVEGTPNAFMCTDGTDCNLIEDLVSLLTCLHISLLIIAFSFAAPTTTLPTGMESPPWLTLTPTLLSGTRLLIVFFIMSIVLTTRRLQ